MQKPESRDFKIANNMLFHLIFAQAGTAGKALAELVMNAFDAGSKTFELTIDNKGFKAVDKGRGFRSRKEIEDWFEELGFEHTSELHQQEGRFSRFGLGRAQCMAFASTRWLTNTFIMDVDIKNRGMGFELWEDQPQADGCTIEGTWYDLLSFSDLKTIQREFEELVAYVDMEITVNGNSITKRSTKWDYETDQVFIKRRQYGDLAVYNQGVLIRSYPGYKYGSGIVVSKVPFTLNMARNDILTSLCPVWKEVRVFLRDEASATSRKKTRLTDSERKLLIDQLIDGDAGYNECAKSPLLEDCCGRKWRLSKIREANLVTIHSEGPKLAADRIHQSKQAFVLSAKVLEQFGAETPEDFVELMNRLIKRDNDHARPINYRPIGQLIKTNGNEHFILKDKELSTTEKLALKAMNKALGHLQSAVEMVHGSRMKRRSLYIGQSEQSRAWTDGDTYIAINRDEVRQHARDGFRGFTTLANLLAHELVHERDTTCAHEHDEEFFQVFHDVVLGQHNQSYGTAIRIMVSDFLRLAQKEGLKMSRGETRDVDWESGHELQLFDSTEFMDGLTTSAA